MRSRWPIAVALALVLAVAGCGKGAGDAPPATIGLYTSLPIAWSESEDVRGLLASDAAPHWALDVLRARGKVVPLDTLADGRGALPLPPGSLLVLAQPRPLSAPENVALDAWVQAGGHVLLFADPMLTAESRFAPGDPRRPQDIALLSPILRRWGLELQFDETLAPGERRVRFAGADLPVNLPGRFAPIGESAGSGKAGDVVATCRLEAVAVVAACRAGKGRVVAVADAALLEKAGEPAESGPGADQREAILSQLLDYAVAAN